MSAGRFITPTSPSGTRTELSANEKAWIEFIRVISAARDPAPTPERVRMLRALLDC